MGILAINTQFPGQVGVPVRRIPMISTDNLATVTTAGYLNSATLAGNVIYPTDIIAMWYGYVSNRNPGNYAEFLPSFDTETNQITLILDVNEGNVVLPTIANHIATYVGTDGQITKDAATAINGGNLQAGFSGTAGHLTSFPSAQTTGSLSLTAVANSGNYANVVSNNSTGQATSWLLPDPGVASSQVVVSPSALVSGNLLSASGTLGLTVDSTIAANKVLQSSFASPDTNANLLVVTTGSITNSTIVSGVNLFTPSGSKTYLLIGAVLNVTQSFAGGSNNSDISFTIANMATGAAIITGAHAQLQATAQSYALGQAGFTFVAGNVTITSTNNLFLKVNASSDYTGGVASISFLLQRLT